MGFFDSWSDLVSAATPWGTAEAEAVSGGTGTDKTPAQKDEGGEGEAKVIEQDPSGPTPDKKGGDDDDEDEKEESGGDDEPEEEEDEELVDPKETFEEVQSGHVDTREKASVIQMARADTNENPTILQKDGEVSKNAAPASDMPAVGKSAVMYTNRDVDKKEEGELLITETNSSASRTAGAEGLTAVSTYERLIENGNGGNREGGEAVLQEFKVYKRRWFGLVQLVLLNIIVSWDWLSFSASSTTVSQYYHVSATAVNWLSTGFLFAFVVASPFTTHVLHHRGPKYSIIVASILLLAGNWIRYGATRAGEHGNFGGVVFGQILTGLAQPFVLAAPTRYSDLWFTNRGRVAATAVMSLANPFGGALAQLIDPFWAGGPGDIPDLVLYVSIIASIATIPSFFIPEKPPTPCSHSSTVPKQALLPSLKFLLTSPEFYMIMIPFIIYVGLFNSISSIINQILGPYSFSETDAGIAGALLIVVGLVASAIISPLIDRTKSYLLAIKVLVPIVALSYLAFIWAPQTRNQNALGFDTGPDIRRLVPTHLDRPISICSPRPTSLPIEEPMTIEYNIKFGIQLLQYAQFAVRNCKHMLFYENAQRRNRVTNNTASPSFNTYTHTHDTAELPGNETDRRGANQVIIERYNQA
ncbi:hypothetical protein B7494_g4268 [Chlorociboria aeruginascens]|nr:hypothetical protein B7494_g4268 [Chlorociboria aeruginascens]